MITREREKIEAAAEALISSYIGEFERQGHYFAQINDLMAKQRSTVSVYIYDLNEMLVEAIIREPDRSLLAASEAVYAILERIHPDYALEVKGKIRVEIKGLDAIPMKNVLSEYINHLIAVKGKVTGIGDTEPFLIQAAYRCQECNSLYTPENNQKPRKCQECQEKVFLLDQDACIYGDKQAVKLQELGIGKAREVVLGCSVNYRDLLWTVKPGQKILATGILRAEPVIDSKNGKIRFVKRLEIVGIDQETDEDVVLTQHDIELCKRIAEEPQFYEKLIASFAPHLYGLDEAKEASVLGLGSQGLERPLNIGFFGDPDTGKSELMFYAVELSHNGHKTDMASTSHVGLTVESGYDEETGTRLANPGMLNWADMGLAGIDELQAIKEEDAKKLNGVMESKEINSAKAGVHGVLEARCCIIITSNSAYGRWETSTSILDNLKFLKQSAAALLSRFDLIYIFLDRKEDARDAKVADAIIRTYGKTEIPKDLFSEDTPDRFGFKTLRKYFAYIATLPLPPVPDELNENFKTKYLQARKEDLNSMIGNRFFKSIIRLARIIARVMQKPEVTESDLTRAIELIGKSRNITAFDPRIQKLDANMLNNSTPEVTLKREKNKEEQFWTAYEKARGTEEYAKHVDLMGYLVDSYKWESLRAEQYIRKALAAGVLMESKGQGKYTKRG